MYKATIEVVIDVDYPEVAMDIATTEAKNIESRPKDDAEATVINVVEMERELSAMNVVDEKEVDWGDELGEIPFEVWSGGTYKLVKVD